MPRSAAPPATPAGRPELEKPAPDPTPDASSPRRSRCAPAARRRPGTPPSRPRHRPGRRAGHRRSLGTHPGEDALTGRPGLVRPGHPTSRRRQPRARHRPSPPARPRRRRRPDPLPAKRRHDPVRRPGRRSPAGRRRTRPASTAGPDRGRSTGEPSRRHWAAAALGGVVPGDAVALRGAVSQRLPPARRCRGRRGAHRRPGRPTRREPDHHRRAGPAPGRPAACAVVQHAARHPGADVRRRARPALDPADPRRAAPARGPGHLLRRRVKGQRPP
jgi:hypothetical protein